MGRYHRVVSKCQMWRPGWKQVLAVWAATCVLAAAQAQGVVITQLEGEATVTDGVRRTSALVGQRLGAGALVETGAKTNLLRLEWPDAAVVDLGPASQVMVSPPGFRARGGRAPSVYLLQGWAKVTGQSSAPAGGLVTPQFELMPIGGAVVVFVGAREQQVFAESGAVDLGLRPAGKQRGIAPGALFNGDGPLLARPPADWLQRVPRAFRDPIPRRAAQLKDRTADASVLPPPTYVELSPWLAAEPDVRRDFPRRFAALAQDPAFRRGLQQRLSSHPEWASVLNPSK